jgi:predicted transcriptional regulator
MLHKDKINTLALELIEAIKEGDPQTIADLALKLERLLNYHAT